jgi:hypothetical protein
MNSAEPLIPGGNAALSITFDVLEILADKRRSQTADREAVDGLAAAETDERKHLDERVPIARLCIERKIALSDRVLE